MERRRFIQASAGGLLAYPFARLAASSILGGASYAADLGVAKPIEARFYEKLADKKVRCVLCPRECRVADLERGYCGVRENRGGIYYSLVYGRPCSYGIDPIEKKPLFHFKPSTATYSLATAGCNVECKFCQNWNISQMRPEQVESVSLPPAKVVDEAIKYRAKSIAFTYTEPVVFAEYLIDTAREGKRKGIPTVMITNGFIKREPLLEICASVPAIKVDLKAFSEEFYRDYVNGELSPVLDSLTEIVKSKTWLEIVVLIIPGRNDSAEEVGRMTGWVREKLGKSVPIHFSRFHPMYKMLNVPSTPVGTLERCREIGMKNGLDFVYLGNVPGHPGENTYCPKCREKLIERLGYAVMKNSLKNGACPKCGEKIAGVWS